MTKDEIRRIEVALEHTKAKLEDDDNARVEQTRRIDSHWTGAVVLVAVLGVLGNLTYYQWSERNLALWRLTQPTRPSMVMTHVVFYEGSGGSGVSSDGTLSITSCGNKIVGGGTDNQGSYYLDGAGHVVDENGCHTTRTPAAAK